MARRTRRTKARRTQGRALAATPPPDPQVAKQPGRALAEVGVDGVSAYSALDPTADREDNPDLQRPRRFFTFDDMWFSDPQIRALLWLVKLPIRSATWTIEEPDDATDVDVVAADLCRWQLGLEDEPGWLLGGWERNLSESLLKVNYGCMSHEIVWDNVVTWTDTDGDDHLIRPMFRLAPRFPHAVENYLPPVPGVRTPVAGLEQMMHDVVIPGDKLVHRVLEPEGNQFLGVSMIRPAYGAWKIKSALLVSSAIAYDRWAAGLPVFWLPAGASAQDEERARAMGRDLRSHERSYAILKGPRGSEQGWDFDIRTGAVNDPTGYLRYLDEQIASAGLAHFSKLGTTQTGARAVGEVLAEPFYLALTAIGEETADEWEEQVLSRVVAVNIGGEVDVPKLKISRITERSVEQLSMALANLGSAGFSFADPGVQNEVRAIMQLPPLPIAGVVEGPPQDGESLGPATAEDAAAVVRAAQALTRPPVTNGASAAQP